MSQNSFARTLSILIAFALAPYAFAWDEISGKYELKPGSGASTQSFPECPQALLVLPRAGVELKLIELCNSDNGCSLGEEFARFSNINGDPEEIRFGDTVIEQRISYTSGNNLIGQITRGYSVESHVISPLDQGFEFRSMNSFLSDERICVYLESP